MRFGQIELINLLWLVALLGAFLLVRRKAKYKAMERFADKGLLREIAKSLDKRNEFTKAIVLVAVCIFAVFSLVRPQWGFEWREIKREGLDILVAIDTSRSMLTDDVKPNRLERSKLAVKDLVKKLNGDRIGLIAFAGQGFMVCPLTVDYHGFLLSLNDLSTDTIPLGGTSIASAISESLRSYKDIASKYKALVLITDGEDLEGNVAQLAEQAAKEGVKIFCIGIGTKEGELIRYRNNSGEYEFVKDKDGNFVKSRLNEKMLQEIAVKTSGMYVRASGAQFGLDLIYEERLSKMEKRELKTKMEIL